MTNIIGIDIGAQGALALLDEGGDLVEIADMPILRDGPKNRPSVNGALLAPIIRRWQPSCAYVEYVGARPGEGAVGAFAFGRSRGVVEGVLGACGVPATTISAARSGAIMSARRQRRGLRRTGLQHGSGTCGHQCGHIATYGLFWSLR